MRPSLLAAGLLGLAATPLAKAPAGLRFSVSFPAARSNAALDGRLLILIAADSSAEPRLLVSDNVTTAQVYGMDVEGWKPGEQQVAGSREPGAVNGYPLRTLAELPKGRYRVQALLNRYETLVDYGARAEHCWNGDHTRPNATSRLRYHQMFIPRILGEIQKRHPRGVDTVSWRY